MSNWIPERNLGYTSDDYQKMPTSQFISLLIRDLALRIGLLACYIFMAAWIFVIGCIVIAILYVAYQIFGIIGAVFAAIFMLIIHYSEKQKTEYEPADPKPSNGLSFSDIIFGMFIWNTFFKKKD